MSMSVQTGEPPTPEAAAPVRRRFGVAAAALLGVVAVGVTFGLAELLSALGQWTGWLGTASSPVAALGSSFIDLTPEWLKEWAIREFGTNDKTALRIGMGATVLVAAAVIGLVGRWRPRMAVALAGVLLFVAAVAVLTRSNASPFDLLPLLVGAVAGLWVLVTGLRLGLGLAGTGFRLPAAPTEPNPTEANPTEANPAKANRTEANPAESGPADPGPTGPDRITPNKPNAITRTAMRSGYDRRAFFRLAGLSALVAVAAGALSRWIPNAAAVEASREAVQIPQATNVQPAPAGASAPASAAGGTTVVEADGTLDDVSGITPYVTANGDFYRIDTAFVFPGLTAENWKLKIHGACDNPFEIDFATLIKRPMIERMVTLTCVSNEVGGDLAGNAKWQGVRIADLLAEAKPRAEADCVLSTSAQDGFTVTTPLSALTDGRDAILAVKMNGEALPVEHGFPVRMVVPGLYGYVSATKWVVDMEITDFAQTTSFWSERGWAAQAPIKTASRIDTPKSFAKLPVGRVAVAGVAWAQHRGIKAVQVQVDDGPWNEAILSTPVSDDTWVQWMWPWPATAGEHTLRVRAIDGTNELQTGSRQDVMPDGATGWHSRVVTVS
jgi:DMSO/TMAO reductase YedYZ molybdopterin-dependent catalytic subunit